MTSVLFDLFDEYAVAYARGERPDLRAYLERAGSEADQLAELVDRWLVEAPAPMPEPERVELMRAWVRGEPPLVELRGRRGLKRGAVIDALIAALSIDPAKREKVRDYYHRLEVGTLDPAGVSRQVWEALTGLLGTDARSIASWRPRPIEAAPAFRLAEPKGSPATELYHRVAPSEPDEVDRLFTSGL